MQKQWFYPLNTLKKTLKKNGLIFSQNIYPWTYVVSITIDGFWNVIHKWIINISKTEPTNHRAPPARPPAHRRAAPPPPPFRWQLDSGIVQSYYENLNFDLGLIATKAFMNFLVVMSRMPL
jgi:hypothetical protein